VYLPVEEKAQTLLIQVMKCRNVQVPKARSLWWLRGSR
jgi:hypothetical protein